MTLRNFFNKDLSRLKNSHPLHLPGLDELLESLPPSQQSLTTPWYQSPFTESEWGFLKDTPCTDLSTIAEKAALLETFCYEAIFQFLCEPLYCAGTVFKQRRSDLEGFYNKLHLASLWYTDNLFVEKLRDGFPSGELVPNSRALLPIQYFQNSPARQSLKFYLSLAKSKGPPTLLPKKMRPVAKVLEDQIDLPFETKDRFFSSRSFDDYLRNFCSYGEELSLLSREDLNFCLKNSPEKYIERSLLSKLSSLRTWTSENIQKIRLRRKIQSRGYYAARASDFLSHQKLNAQIKKQCIDIFESYSNELITLLDLALVDEIPGAISLLKRVDSSVEGKVKDLIDEVGEVSIRTKAPRHLKLRSSGQFNPFFLDLVSDGCENPSRESISLLQQIWRSLKNEIPHSELLTHPLLRTHWEIPLTDFNPSQNSLREL